MDAIVFIPRGFDGPAGNTQRRSHSVADYITEPRPLRDPEERRGSPQGPQVSSLSRRSPADPVAGPKTSLARVRRRRKPQSFGRPRRSNAVASAGQARYSFPTTIHHRAAAHHWKQTSLWKPRIALSSALRSAPSSTLRRPEKPRVGSLRHLPRRPVPPVGWLRRRTSDRSRRLHRRRACRADLLRSARLQFR